MKKIFAALTASTALVAVSAHAADNNAAAWAGPYVGAAVGAGIDKHVWTTTSVTDPLNQIPTDGNAPGDYANPGSLNKSGVRGEAFVGYNVPVSTSVIAGVEVGAGYNFSGGKSIYGIPGTFVNAVETYPAGQPDFTAGKTTWDGSVRARLGYAASSSTLVYAAAGVAFGNVEYRVSCIDGPGWCDANQDEKQSQIRAGLTVGAGIEHKLSPSVSARLDYHYVNYGTKTSSWLAAVGTDTFVAETKLKTHAVMVGLSYSFGK